MNPGSLCCGRRPLYARERQLLQQINNGPLHADGQWPPLRWQTKSLAGIALGGALIEALIEALVGALIEALGEELEEYYFQKIP